MALTRAKKSTNDLLVTKSTAKTLKPKTLLWSIDLELHRYLDSIQHQPNAQLNFRVNYPLIQIFLCNSFVDSSSQKFRAGIGYIYSYS